MSYDQEIASTIRQINQVNSTVNSLEGKVAATQVKIEKKLSIYVDEVQKKQALGQPAVVALTRELSGWQKELKNYQNQKKSLEKILGGQQLVKQKAKAQQDEVENTRRALDARLERQRNGGIVDPYKEFPQQASNVRLSEGSQSRLANSRDRRKPVPRRGR